MKRILLLVFGRLFLFSASVLYAQTPAEMNNKGRAARVVKNYTEAITWYRKAAEQGNAEAQCNLGTCYYVGMGVSQDYAQAVAWYHKAAEQGDAQAQSFLGYCYKYGHGVLQDYAEAAMWYRKAAEQDLDKAQTNLDNILKEPKYLAQVKKILDSPFSTYAKPYVEQRVNEWQKKGEFEKTSDWQARVNETTRREKIAQLTKAVQQEYVEKCATATPLTCKLGDYDADNEVFLVKWENKNMLVPVPIAEAEAFKSGWSAKKQKPSYFIENDKIALSEMRFTLPSGKEYKYSNEASLNYSVAQVDYNFDPIEIDVAASTPSKSKGNQTISQTKVSIGKSDVDTNIPQTAAVNDKTFAVIIANENYQRESEVEFANNDGETLRTYCVKTLGMPEANVHYVADATLNNMRAEIDWITKVAAAYNGQANILFYYAGHGIPDEGTRAVYLLPVDGYGSNVITGYKLSDLYAKLADCGAKSAVVFLDACFSGAQRSGEMLASARGVAIKAKPETPLGNMVVFSAAQGDETAYPYREKGHGMFTYFLLKKLQATQGSATLGELNDYIVENVSQRSIVTNSKSQTPTVTSAGALLDGWKTIRLR